MKNVTVLTSLVCSLAAVLSVGLPQARGAELYSSPNPASTDITPAVIELPESVESEQLLAQAYPVFSENVRGLSATGNGSVSVPVDSVRLQLFFYPDDSAALTEPAPEPPQPQSRVTESALRPVVAALRELGIADSDIEVTVSSGLPSPYGYPYGESSIYVDVATPSSERLQEIVQAVNTVAEESDDISVGAVNIRYAVSDCEAAENEANMLALRDAQTRAETLASNLGAELGGVIFATQNPSYSDPASCPQNLTSSFPSAGFFGYDPSMLLQVQVYSTVYVTYTIED